MEENNTTQPEMAPETNEVVTEATTNDAEETSNIGNETEQEERKPLGRLFNTINYFTNEDLNRFISGLTTEQSLYCLIQCARAAQSRNALTLEEAEVISKSIRTITTPQGGSEVVSDTETSESTESESAE